MTNRRSETRRAEAGGGSVSGSRRPQAPPKAATSPLGNTEKLLLPLSSDGEVLR